MWYKYSQEQNKWYYSHLTKTLQEIGAQSSRLRADQLLATLKKAGVKKDELYFTGMENWLESMGNNPLSLQSAIDFASQHAIQVNDMVRKESMWNRPELVLGGRGDDYFELLLVLPGETKFSHMHWMNQQEIMQRMMNGLGEHAGIPNVVAHARLTSRNVNGEKILFIEEIESDWHQSKDNPEAPFAKAWPEVMLKRVVHWAATNGYARVAWTNGAQQMERNDIRQHADKIVYDENSGMMMAFKNDVQVQQGMVPDGMLPLFIGKAASQALMQNPIGGGRYEIEGDALAGNLASVGRFYDKEVPGIISNQVRNNQWDSDLQPVNIHGEVQSLPITEYMKTNLKNPQRLV